MAIKCLIMTYTFAILKIKGLTTPYIISFSCRIDVSSCLGGVPHRVELRFFILWVATLIFVCYIENRFDRLIFLNYAFLILICPKIARTMIKRTSHRVGLRFFILWGYPKVFKALSSVGIK